MTRQSWQSLTHLYHPTIVILSQFSRVLCVVESVRIQRNLAILLPPLARSFVAPMEEGAWTRLARAKELCRNLIGSPARLKEMTTASSSIVCPGINGRLTMNKEVIVLVRAFHYLAK